MHPSSPYHAVAPAMAIAILMSGATPARGAAPAAFANDLKATIALQGMPCDQIVQSTRQGDSDYIAACKDGNRYHVFVNPQGRVVVQKL